MLYVQYIQRGKYRECFGASCRYSLLECPSQRLTLTMVLSVHEDEWSGEMNQREAKVSRWLLVHTLYMRAKQRL